MKKILSLLFLTIISLSLSACSSANAQGEVVEKETTLKIGAPIAPPTIPILRMVETNALGKNVNIQLDTWTEPESLIAMVQGKDHGIFAMPLTVASTLKNKGSDVKLLNVNTWGVTYLVSADENVKSFKDLKNETIYVPAQSSPPDALTQYFLKEAGLTVGKDVTIKYASGAEIAALLVSGKAKHATLLEPQVSNVLSKNDNLKVALSFEDQWQNITNSKTLIPNAGIGTTETFSNENKDLVALFEKEYEKALTWVNKNPKEAAKLASKSFKIDENIIEKAIPNMGLVYKSAKDSKEELQMFYELLYNFEPKMIGGKIVGDSLIYED